MRLKDIRLIVKGLAPVFREYVEKKTSPADMRLDALEARMSELEKRPTAKWAGIWQPEKSYQPGNLVTRSGSLWISILPTSSAPGTDDSGAWRLIVKQGAFR